MSEDILFAAALSGFHTLITLLALYRARKAWASANAEGIADRRTLWRLAALRLIAAVVALTGGLLALCPPLAYLSSFMPALIPTSPGAMMTIVAAAWLSWIVTTIALDNLALRWLR